MAEIFLARGDGVTNLARYCVLKRILRERASDVTFVRMFLDEARLAAQLQHPNIAQVYDIGKLGDSYFFTMEYVHGETVRALLHRAQGLRRQLPISCVMTIAAGTAAGLHHAHGRLGFDGRALGIVHRDVTPSNLMVSYEGGVKVVDFGVAKAADRAHETKSGTVKGKISYLSPEQCKGKRVDRRSDLFSLGICFWEMLTTERLYKRDSDFENMNAIVTEPTPPPSSRRPDIPREVDELVLRLLAKSADDRFQTADEVVEAIEAVAARTSSVLSSSALGRLVRELFGQRPEPWLELEAQRDQGEGVSVTSEPIPLELVSSLAEQVDLQLSSVIDLSAGRIVTESLESLGAMEALGALGVDLPTARHSKLALGLAPTLVPPRPLASPAPLAPTVSIALADVIPELGRVGPPPVPARTASPPPRSRATPPGPLHGKTEPRLTPSTTFSAASGAFAAPSGERIALAGSRSDRRRGALRYAAIGGAVMLGALAIALVMRSGDAGRASIAGALDPAAAPARPTEPVLRAPASRITVVPIPEPSTASGSSASGGSATRSGESGIATGSGAIGSGAAAEPASAAAPTAHAATRDAKPRGDARGSVVPAPSAPRGEPARPAPARREPGEDEVTRSFTDARYDRVIALCSTGPVSAERAPFCFLAACHLNDEVRARRLIIAVPAASRDALSGHCKELGVDITAKKQATPAVDCDADPMACQH